MEGPARASNGGSGISRRSWMSLPRKERDKEKASNKDGERDGEPLRRTPSGSSFPRLNLARSGRSQSIQSMESTGSASGQLAYPVPAPTRRATSSLSLAQDGGVGGGLNLRRTESTPGRANARLRPAESVAVTRPAPPRYSISSMLSLGRTREKADDAERGRSSSFSARRSSFGSAEQDRSRSRGRSTSPFRFRARSRPRRDTSPSSVVEALSLDAESDSESTPRIRPRNAFSVGDDDSDEDDSDESEESWSSADDEMDEITAQHTEANAAVASPVDVPLDGDLAEPDPLGEGVNVIIPSEPYFPSTQFSSAVASPGARTSVRRRKSSKMDKGLLPMLTSRPQFSRDRCIIKLVHGDPKKVLTDNGRAPRKYIVASDLSEESRYAVEWGIGTVLRDGDEMLIVTVVESESKLDPPSGGQVDRLTKLRSQQDRQTLAYLLVRQATGLLQRTKLHVRMVNCSVMGSADTGEDLIDYHSPSMVIVGSRGLTRLKGILLGSTSHYLIQKSSVPVMVARRRLKRPAKKSAHLAPHRARVSLAEAAIDKVGPGKVDKDVEVMRDELQREDAREAVDLRLAGTDRGLAEEDEENDETEPAYSTS